MDAVYDLEDTPKLASSIGKADINEATGGAARWRRQEGAKGLKGERVQDQAFESWIICCELCNKQLETLMHAPWFGVHLLTLSDLSKCRGSRIQVSRSNAHEMYRQMNGG